jgi:single-strand DNA-binding protein
MNINHVIVSGRVGADPELRYTPNKLAILTMSIAQPDYQKDKESKPMWFDVIIFDKYAEALHHTIKKGDEVIASGKIKISSYQDKSGNERKNVQIVANAIRLLTYRKKAELPEMSTSEPAPRSKQNLSFSDEDIPF